MKTICSIFILSFIFFSCSKKKVNKIYVDYATATVNGAEWQATADVIHKKNIFGDDVWLESISLHNPSDNSVIDLDFYSSVYGNENTLYNKDQVNFIYRNSGISSYYSTENNFNDCYGKLVITEYNEGVGLKATFEFIAYKTDSSKITVLNGKIEAKDE